MQFRTAVKSWRTSTNLVYRMSTQLNYISLHYSSPWTAASIYRLTDDFSSVVVGVQLMTLYWHFMSVLCIVPYDEICDRGYLGRISMMLHGIRVRLYRSRALLVLGPLAKLFDFPSFPLHLSSFASVGYAVLAIKRTTSRFWAPDSKTMTVIRQWWQGKRFEYVSAAWCFAAGGLSNEGFKRM